MQNKAPRTEGTRFISAWHSQSELQGQDQNPGPKYENATTIGAKHSPAFGFGNSKAHDAGGQVFISATHSKENKGIDGPGPGAYSPRLATTPRCEDTVKKTHRANSFFVVAASLFSVLTQQHCAAVQGHRLFL